MSSESAVSTRRERVLVVGGGGREHALCYALARSPQLERGFWIPGNGAIIEKFEKHARPEGDENSHEGWIAFCQAKKISLVIIGPEAFLAKGLADGLRGEGMAVLGPSAAAARLESDKHFAKTIMARAQVSTGRATLVSALDELEPALSNASLPFVVKACGLAEGKGVTICHTLAEARRASHRILRDQVFGDSALLLEEFLSGEEFSFFALCAGRLAIPLGSARDYKRALDNDEGPNTGGMGGASPAPIGTHAGTPIGTHAGASASAPPTPARAPIGTQAGAPIGTQAGAGGDAETQLAAQVMNDVIHPVLRTMDEHHAPFHGVLYAGLIRTPPPESELKVIEFNARFGDPECQLMLARALAAGSDVLVALAACARGQVVKLSLGAEHAMAVVLAAPGYPENYPKNIKLPSQAMLAAIEKQHRITVFHAGTKATGDALESSGGRVFTLTATDPNPSAARTRLYQAVESLQKHFPSCQFRSDIGKF